MMDCIPKEHLMRSQLPFRAGIAIFTLALALALAGCGERADVAAQSPMVQPVKLYTVGTADEQRLRRFPAVVEAAQVAQLAFRVGGEIIEFPVKPGTRVQPGDLIARLDPTDYQLVLDQAQARFELADSQYRRTYNLVNEGVISPQQFDEVKSNLDIARANLETARANVRYTELRAPFAGTIANVLVERFETVQPQRPIATLQLDDAIDVSIRVPETLFARVQRQVDYQPEVIFPALPERSFTARLKEWDSTADPATNTYRVVFTLPTPSDVNILPGMSATVMIGANLAASASQLTQLVPASALFSPTHQAPSESYSVWVYNPSNQRVSLRAVTVHAITNKGAEISAGLQAGEQIVVAGVHALTDQQQVRPWLKERG